MSDSLDEKQNVLNATVVKLGLVSLFSDVASEMLYPITPIFLTTVLGASMASVGLVEGSAECLASLLKAYAGAWSDRSGKRKAFVVWGYLLSSVAKPMIGFAGAWPEVLLARGTDRTGKALRGGPRDALISDAVDPKILGAAFGWHRAMDTIGAAIGPLFAIWYLHRGFSLRGIFFWSLVPGLVAVLFTLSVREKVAAKKPVQIPHWEWGKVSSAFKSYLVTWGIFSISNSSDVFLLLKAKTVVPLETTILMYCLYNLIYALLSPSLGKLSDSLGRKPLLAVGFVVFALVYTGFALATSPWQFALLFAVYGIYMAATDGVGKAYAIDLVDPAHKATGVGMLGTITGIATLAANSLGGMLWDSFGAPTTFLFGAAGAVLAALSLAGHSLYKR